MVWKGDSKTTWMTRMGEGKWSRLACLEAKLRWSLGGVQDALGTNLHGRQEEAAGLGRWRGAAL